MAEQDPTRVRLLEAAGHEFADKGFECARVRSICDRAGANLAAVNYHFGSKEQLYFEVVVEAHRSGLSTEGMGAVAERNPALALRMFIHQFLKDVLAINHPDDWRHRLMLREMLEPSRALDVLIRESIQPHFQFLKGIMAQICPDADDRRLSALAFSVIGQCMHYKMANRFGEELMGTARFRELDVDYLTDHISAVCLAAFGLTPPLNSAGVLNAHTFKRTESI